MLPDFVDGADVRMIQRRCGTGFAQEAFIGLPILGDAIGQKFEGDEAVQRGVFGLVDHTHAAATQLLHDPVVRNHSMT